MKLLCGLMLFFAATLFAAEKYFKDDSQLFQVIAQLLTGFSASFLTRIKSAPGPVGPAGPSGTDAGTMSVKTETSVTTEPPPHV